MVLPEYKGAGITTAPPTGWVFCLQIAKGMNMELTDTTSEKSIMEDVDAIERVNVELINLRHQAIAFANKAEEQLRLREQLQDEISMHIGENEIDITQFDKSNQERIELWLVDW